MNGALFFADVQASQAADASASARRDINCIAGLDYDAIPEDDLRDLQLDRTSVLTPEGESRLFLQMNRYYHRAIKLREVEQGQTYSKAEATVDNELARADELRNLIVVIFHKLTVSIAKNFISSRHTLEELVSEGDATLLRAVTLFDPSRGYRFSTYATYAIRRRLARYVTSSQHTHATPVDFRDAPPIPDQRRWSLPYEQAMHAGVEWLETALYELSARERYIVRCRFGWGREFEPRTLQEIADELGVSRERVRQLEAKAITKLREVAAGIDVAVI
ncbi:MAG: sigma-70 family RNA polymerase sigma factor [Planctomycetaceae bacterium]|nr:sigma-70 family RNA polymerase sigma factor [Planctomycetales bacterium]MCB9875153.1 sigma-70 family RNA polymerase sigma factor [Planctomycetaceae bacterium]MCB9937182.1 sigma-70 family RNA polymerase sigma factor [Planctomycetaceae bacterium]